MSDNVYVFIHAYRSKPEVRPVEPVVKDRITTAHNVADIYAALGANTNVIFLGSFVDDDGTKTCEKMRDYAREYAPELIEAHDWDVIWRPGGNTRAEIKSAIEYLDDTDDTPAAAISVSSKDHAPRITRLWNELHSTTDDYLVSVTASDERYGYAPPFILEAAEYEPFVDVLDRIFQLDPDHYEDAAQEIADRLDEYVDPSSNTAY